MDRKLQRLKPSAGFRSLANYTTGLHFGRLVNCEACRRKQFDCECRIPQTWFVITRPNPAQTWQQFNNTEYRDPREGLPIRAELR